MKKLYLIISAAFTVVSLNASAQTINGSVQASDITVTQNGSSILLQMVLHIEQDAVLKCQSVAIAPTLSKGADRIVFPYVLVNGKNKSRMLDRKKKFENTLLMQNPPLEVVDIDRKNRGKTVNYSAEVPYQFWMEDASLSLDLALSSCADELQLYTMELSDVSVVLTPQTPPAPIVVEVPPVDNELETKRYISGSAYLDFEAGSSAILPSFMRNPQELANVKTALDRIRNYPRKIGITGLTIVGYASPEGRYESNETLASNRALAFADYIQKEYGIQAQYSNVGAVAEDWDTFRTMVADSDLPYKSRVLSIIDSDIAPDAKESQLRRLEGGSVWRTILDTMFPQLRRVEYKIDYEFAE